MYINSISAIKMGSQSKHLKPVSWTPSVCRDHRNPKEPCIRSHPRRRTDRERERERVRRRAARLPPALRRIALVARGRCREKISDCPAALGPAEQLAASAESRTNRKHRRDSCCGRRHRLVRGNEEKEKQSDRIS